VRSEQRLDVFSQLRIRRAFSVEDGGLTGRIRRFDRRKEDGLNAFRIDCHGSVLRRDLTLDWHIIVDLARDACKFKVATTASGQDGSSNIAVERLVPISCPGPG
jgi:hypothetical protein